MAATETQIGPTIREPVTGYTKRRYKIVLSGGGTSFTLSDTSWQDVVEITWFEAGTDTGNAVYWDGSDVKGTGFTADTTVKVSVTGYA